jgi:hypothetical protein
MAAASGPLAFWLEADPLPRLLLGLLFGAAALVAAALLARRALRRRLPRLEKVRRRLLTRELNGRHGRPAGWQSRAAAAGRR